MNKSSTNEANEHSFKDRHSFVIFISGSILLASFLVYISMSMYNSSGAAQLDLSRPGYVSVRSQAVSSGSNLEAFSSNGSIDQSVIDDFRTKYQVQAGKVTTVDAFGGSPLSSDALGISVSSSSTN